MKDGVDANDGGEGVRIDVDAETWDMRINSTVQELWLFELIKHVKDGLSTPARFAPAFIKMQADTLSRIGGMVATPDTTPANKVRLVDLISAWNDGFDRVYPEKWAELMAVLLHTHGGSQII